ncbi:MAG: hypothetical protein RL495_1442, partial [Verrucomicrobiota bacterium]
VAYLSVEISAEDLEPVGLAMVAHRGTAEAAGGVEVEQDGQVWADGSAGEAIGGFDERAIKATTTRLIGDRGIDKTIAEHDLARSEGRRDDLGDELCPAGREQEGLSGRLDDRAGMLEDIPHLLAKGRTAGLTEAQYPFTGSTETIRQPGQLRGLSRAFPSFERDEFTSDRHAPSRCPSKGAKRAEKPSAHKKARHQPGLFERSEPRISFRSRSD